VEPPPLDRKLDRGAALEAEIAALNETRPHAPLHDTAAATARLRAAMPGLDDAFAHALAARQVEPCTGGVRWRWDARLRRRAIDIGTAGDWTKPGGWLSRITSPTIVLRADSSGGDTVTGAWSSLVRWRTLQIGGGHNLHIEAPDAVAAAVAEVAARDIQPVQHEGAGERSHAGPQV
jgi:pimeloyl-ACP methyl ester carboxylesterase